MFFGSARSRGRSCITEEYEDTVTWETHTIPYRYRFSNRRTIGILVHQDCSVRVTAHRGTSPETIKAFVLEKGKWIIKAWRKFEERTEAPALNYVSGGVHHYIGNPYYLQVKEGRRDSVICECDCLTVTSKAGPAPQRTKAILESWYRSRAVIVFQERLAILHQQAVREGIPFPKLRIRRMKSRWGSWSSTGWITLNLMLIKAPMECIDYVIIHELCHFKFRSHGPRFWNAVQRLMPGYKERRKKLNTQSALI